MRPQNLKTKIFLDGGDPKETKEIISLLGFLDGQTTNPTLIAKNPDAQAKLARGEKFTVDEIYDFYKKIVREVSTLIPNGSVSVEVFADRNTTPDAMLKQGEEMFSWIPNAHVKYPTTNAGLTAAEKSIQSGMRVNMTLVFNEEQAAAVYAATSGAKKGDVFLSPFIGRLDDIGINGMDLVKNCVQLYQNRDRHVEVLSASVRTMDHFLCSLKYGADIITAPYKILKEWAEAGMQIPDENYFYTPNSLSPIAFQNFDLNKPWKEFNIQHDLTYKGIEKFASDWNGLIEN